MRLLDELRHEHDLIEGVLGSLRTFVHERARGAGDPADGVAFLRFFRLHAGDFHHGREEELLFTALVDKAELPGDKGPIPALREQHHAMAALLEAMAPLLGSTLEETGERTRLVDLARTYAHALWRHIDAENSVLLPEARARLRRSGIFELEGPPPSPQEAAAGEEGMTLLHRYPPAPDPEALRGEGCVICPSFGTLCEGVEREWWNEFEWEEFPDHLG
ncbi:MAG: hemerythrin domain-containing protein [Acidobacteria bacterium]|nr:hemerythrin domain-containing protein [Acidobacteriota bacterium]